MAQEYSVHFLYVDREAVILYSVQIVPTTFIVFENFFILLILFSSSEYNYTISEIFRIFWDFDFLPILYRKNFVLSTRKRVKFKCLLYTIQGPLTIYKILFFLLILLKKCRRKSIRKNPLSTENGYILRRAPTKQWTLDGEVSKILPLIFIQKVLKI